MSEFLILPSRFSLPIVLKHSRHHLATGGYNQLKTRLTFYAQNLEIEKAQVRAQNAISQKDDH